MKRGTSYLIAALLIWGFAVQSARAGLVTIGFTAEVTYLDDPYSVFEGGIDVGDTITGTYIYDTSTPDLIPNPWIALYEHTCSACGISLEVGEFEIKTDPSNVEFVVSIGNDIADLTGYAWDSFELKSENNLPLYDNIPIRRLDISLNGTTEAISSDLLPTTAPVLDDWNLENILYISGGYSRINAFSIKGPLTSAVLIPEPATFVLFAIGGLAVLKKRRITRRQKYAKISNS